jgi:holo-[acyl-carrier protein] synthase
VDHSTGSVRVGVDLMPADEVARSVAAFGQRYLDRVYTPHEQACSTGTPTVAAEHLAARFAAKEAVIKVLRPTAAQPPWPSIEVRRDAGGWCEIALSGPAAAMARQQGLDHFTVSLAHEAGMAVAVVAAQVDTEASSHGR